MDAQRSKRASLERQTQLAHIKLISKYYGYEGPSRPKTDDAITAAAQQHRRAGHSYPGHPVERILPDATAEKRTSEPIPKQQQQQQKQKQQQEPSGSPTRRRKPTSRTLGRTSCGSDGSTPSLIEDKTDSEVSHDDDYQYHASTSQLWDSFWAGQKAEGARARMHHGPAQNRPPTKAAPDQGTTTRYPALIPSPHIKRTKKTSVINYEDENLPPRPVQYSIPVHQPDDTPVPPQKTLPPQWPSNTTVEEKQKTIRTVKSSYSLFPRQAGGAPPPPLPPPPLSPAFLISSFPRPATGTPAPATFQRKASRPQPIHIHSDPLPQIPEPREAPAPPRPHTSHGSSRASASSQGSSTPLFPSTNLLNLINPRSAPRPPTATAVSTPQNPGPSRCRRLFTAPRGIPQSLTLTNQKSFFDFDSDTEEDTPEAHPQPPPSRGSGIARIMKKGRKSKGDADMVPSLPPTPGFAPVSNELEIPRASAERIRRRGSRTNLAILGRKPTTDDFSSPLVSPALISPALHSPALSSPALEDHQKKKSDVFGRMFGRGRH
ncbi:hypothetical protein F5X68DRAFT_191140 [Plectosphaerella plurivora]|uniref:Uncharacterized protein n=1 Tax=Plectosphaerella plurivora TaxID=936078 RepID=A0A9P8VCI0_9PEZI|nr:hypothetical protein F5X68DRAFT_191140 [Plectosphaerella plurivora]